MKKDSHPGQTEEWPCCSWCGMLLSADEAGKLYQNKQPVCQRCVSLLMGAGIADEEIFGTPAKEHE